VTRATLVLALSLPLCGARALRAQSASDLLGAGVRAYQALDYAAAAALLERSLGRDLAARLADSLRARALTYLAATELFGGQRDSAVAAFRQLVLLNPRYRPDELIFPPQVTNLFQEVRRATRAIAVAVPPVTELRTRLEQFTARVLASSLADVTVTLAQEDGTPVRQLYSGPVADSQVVAWDGLTAAGAPADNGRYVLRVTPQTPTADGPRARQVVLEVKRELPDTLAWPPEPPFLPERMSSGPAFRSLAAGLVAGAAAVALPSILAPGKDATGARFAVGATVGVAGFVGFFARKPRPLDANVRANASLRDTWKQKLDAVRAENAARLRTVRLVVRAGPETIAERGSP
jgi:flagellar hook capping protein FlgD